DGLIERGEPLDRELVAGLLALVSDARVEESLRADALEVLGRAPGADAALVERVAALATVPELETGVRFAVVTALHEMADANDAISSETRRALVCIAAGSADASLRAAALEGLASSGASADEVARILGFVADGDPDVRGAAARAVAGTD